MHGRSSPVIRKCSNRCALIELDRLNRATSEGTWTAVTMGVNAGGKITVSRATVEG